MMTITSAYKQSPLALRKKYASQYRPSIEELKKKYESSSAFETPKTSKPKSPKKMKKSKVKQMASLFNAKITQILKRDAEVAQYSSLKNEFSPEPKPQPKAAALSKPLPITTTEVCKEKVAISSPRTKSKATVQPKSMYFVAEDVFDKLTVKDKAQLYTQFIEDMSKKNNKFGQHVEFMEANITNEVTQGEVVNEKQESVKHLLEELESAGNSPKQAKSSLAVQRMNSVKRVCSSRRKSETAPLTIVKSKEFEDISLKKVSSKYAFTVTIKPNPEVQKPRRARSLPRTVTEAQELIAEMTTKKTSQEVEKCGESKKNRRPKKFFKNQQLENLFFTWFKEKHDHKETKAEMSSQSEIDEEKQKSIIDKLLEEAIAKLEVVETKQKKKQSMEEKEIDNKANEIQSVTFQKTTSKCFQTVLAKKSDIEESGESGLSSLPKITSEESQAETQPKNDNNFTTNFEFVQPMKAVRKKKIRRVLKEINTLTSTDSENDSKISETKTKNKSLFIQPPTKEVKANVENPLAPTLSELDQSLLMVMISPRKIKSAYTLTVNDLETSHSQNRHSSRCWPSEVVNQISKELEQKNKDQTLKLRETEEIAQPKTLVDSFTDQGFETEAKEFDSPFSTPERLGMNYHEYRRLSIDNKPQNAINGNKPQNAFGFSTPITNQFQPSFSCTNSAKQQLFSPITKPLKNHRRSFYGDDSRRNSLAMQVITEDQPLEHTELVNSITEQHFFANAPTLDMTKVETNSNSQKSSKYWIKCGDFSVALEINYNDAERLRLLYEIFSQTSCNAKDLHFGIDNHKFSVHDPSYLGNTSTRIKSVKGTSHYWFSTGDLALPFSGKYLSSDKILRLFQFVKASVEESGILRFGVDEVEFSNIPEFWNQPPKFSMESNYSMLVGLQSGNSNGLEGRSKYAWPHSKPVPISDLDHSDFEAADIEEIESGRLSFSPFGSNHYDLSALDTADLSMPRNSDAIMSLESYCYGYENEPLDNLFDDKFSHESTDSITIPQMITTVQNQKERLSLVQQRLSSCYAKLSFLSKDALDDLKDTPEYISKLKSIVADISNIGCSNNFKECSVEQLENYMYFLSRYADICLNSCSDHMDNVLDALIDYKAVLV